VQRKPGVVRRNAKTVEAGFGCEWIYVFCDV
jgi:hypothetical protein